MTIEYEELKKELAKLNGKAPNVSKALSLLKEANDATIETLNSCNKLIDSLHYGI